MLRALCSRPVFSRSLRRSPIGLISLVGCVSVLALTSVPAQAEYVLVSGETWRAHTLAGVILLPSGSVFDVEAEQLALITTSVEPADTIVFDVSGGTARLESDPPSVLLDDDPFFAPFAPESEVQTLTSAAGLFEPGPSAAAVDAAGSLTWVGEITAPAPAGGGGGGGPTDSDGDGVPDASDNCPNVANASQTDTDGDGLGDACDLDDDDDGVPDASDNCPTTPNPSQANFDGDALGDACDPDDDGDGLSDVLEIGTYATNPLDPDSDDDGFDDLEEVQAGTDPNDENSFPSPPVPVLGTVGGLLVGAALATLGARRARRLGRR